MIFPNFAVSDLQKAINRHGQRGKL